MQILFVTDGIFPHTVGGIQKHSRLLCEELAKDDQVELIVVHPHADTKVFDASLNIKEEVVQNAKKPLQYIIDCYQYSKEVTRVLDKYPEAVIYAQGFAVWANISKYTDRLVVNPHGLEAFQTLTKKDYYKTAPFRFISNYINRRCKNVISLGGKLTDILNARNGKGSTSIAVIPNAVNHPGSGRLAARTDWSEPFHFLFVGRFAWNKGIEDLLKCAKELNDSGLKDRVRFSLVGKGPLYESLKEKYASPNIYFAGFADDDELENLYSSCHMFILPTLFEGMPTVVLEAMSHGLPIAVTDVGATREQVDSKNGYIINKQDPASIKDAINKFMTLDDRQRTAMSEASINRIDSKFTWSIVASQHIALFNSMND